MDSQPNNPSLKKVEIRFLNDNRAVFVKAAPATPAIDLISALEIKKPATVLLLIGGADDLDPALNTQIEPLLEHGLALAAADTNALIIDGGTRAGVMERIGKVIARSGRVTPLLGIAPAEKVTYPGGPAEGSIPGGAALDPNHSHFVLVEGSQWSDGTEVMFKLVSELAKESRVVVILINGGNEAREEVLRAGKLGWPVIAIQGSGRLADDIAAQVTFADQGEFDVFNLKQNPEGLRELISRHAEGALKEAWRRLKQYDSTAMVNQALHKRLLSFTLAIGVLGTLFALAQKQFTLAGKYYGFVVTSSVLLAAVPVLLMIAVTSLQIFKPKKEKEWILEYAWWIAGSVSGVLLIIAVISPLGFLNKAVTVFQYLAIAPPIIVSILLAGSSRFKNRHKWTLLRGSAEAIKKEIYRYRTRVGDYADQVEPKEDSKEAVATPRRSRDVALKDNIVRITQYLMQTEVNTGSFIYEAKKPPAKPTDDDEFSFLTPERYLEVRLVDQMRWYEGKTATLERQRSEFQWLIYIVGGAGSLLAALGAQLWVALTTAAVTALTAWVADLKLDVNLVKYNQAAADLSNLRYWWSTLSAEDKAELENRQKLVNTTEQILETERASWVQQMEETTKETTEKTVEKNKA